MIVKNEETNLPKCLEAASPLVDEIVIVDTGSVDNTKNIALSFGAKVYDFKWTNNFAAARNYGLKKSTGDWNLILDADEVIVDGDKNTLVSFAKNNPNCIGRIHMTHSFYEDNVLSYSKESLPRFAPKGALYSGKVHEQLDSKYPRKNVSIDVDHSGYLNSNKSDRNLTLILKELEKSPKDNYLLYQAARTYFVSKDYQRADIYFKRCYSSIKQSMSYYKTYIVSYLYNLSNLPNIEEGLKIIDSHRDNLAQDADFNFACGIYYLNLILSNTEKYINYFEYIEESYMKCLEIGETSNNSVLGVGSYKAMYNLATFYEVMGDKQKSINYYKRSADLGFQPAIDRLKVLE